MKSGFAKFFKVLKMIGIGVLAIVVLGAGGIWAKVIYEEHQMWDQYIAAATGPEDENGLLGPFTGRFELVSDDQGILAREVYLHILNEDKTAPLATIKLKGTFGFRILWELQTPEAMDFATLRGNVKGGFGYNLISQKYYVYVNFDHFLMDMAPLLVSCDACEFVHSSEDEAFRFRWKDKVELNNGELDLALRLDRAGEIVLDPRTVSIDAQGVLDLQKPVKQTYEGVSALLFMEDPTKVSWELHIKNGWHVPGIGRGDTLSSVGSMHMREGVDLRDWYQGFLYEDNWYRLMRSIAKIDPFAIEWTQGPHRSVAVLTINPPPVGKSLLDASAPFVSGAMLFDAKAMTPEADTPPNAGASAKAPTVSAQTQLGLKLPDTWQGYLQTREDGMQVWTPANDVDIPPNIFTLDTSDSSKAP